VISANMNMLNLDSRINHFQEK